MDCPMHLCVTHATLILKSEKLEQQVMTPKANVF